MCDMGYKRENEKNLERENIPEGLRFVGKQLDDLLNYNITINKFDPKCQKDVLNDMLEQMPKLLSIAKTDYNCDEAISIKEEFKAMLEECPIDKPHIFGCIDKPHIFDYEDRIDFVSKLCVVGFRTLLMGYKNRGFVVFDEGNGYYSYCCTAEEMLIKIHYKDFEIEY